MKIKYKLILLFILIIIASSLPLSLFILEKVREETMKQLTHQGVIVSRTISKLASYIVLMNGGSIKGAVVDSKEMIDIIKPLVEDGLMYAESIFVSARKKGTGTILASFSSPAFKEHALASLPPAPSAVEKKGVRELVLPGVDDVYYEFVYNNSIGETGSYCQGRVIFSKTVIVAPIRKMQKLVIGATGAVILLVSILGLFISRFISKPIEGLITGVERIEAGDYRSQLPVTSKDELGKLARTFNHLADILQLKIDSLASANKELKRLDILKDEFLANMSHEMRTPLEGIIGLAESLIKGATGSLGIQTKKNLSLLVASGKRLSSLVNDILDFSQLKHHDINIELLPVDMHAITQLVVSIIQPLADKKFLKIDNQIPPGSANVYGDENRLQQVMMNLIGNAIKFTDAGEIRISMHRDNGEDERTVVSVSDTGVGIPADQKENIFEAFQQADGGLTRVYSGSGLGLTITSKLVELHGGNLRVDSEPGVGSRFFFSLKTCPEKFNGLRENPLDFLLLSDPEAPSSGEVHIPREIGRSFADAPKKIMVVDDEPVNIQVLVNHLVLEGYEVITVTDGQEALDMLNEPDLPDLVLLNVMLPRISGYEVCRIIRKKYPTHDLPVLLLTAQNKPGDLVTGFEAGANDYLTKPVDKQELLARVKSLISLKNSFKEHGELVAIEQELLMAQEIQTTLLPEKLPEMEYITIAARYEPMRYVGGDFYDFNLVDDMKFGFLIADASGHGIPAAVVCAMLEVTYSFYKEMVIDPALLLEQINFTMCNYTHEQYVTACYVYINLEEKKIFHAGAGHLPLLIWRQSEKELIQDHENKVPLGVFPETKYNTRSLDLRDGDRIILYTDCILEARNEERETFGDERFHDLIKQYGNSGGEEFADAVLEAVKTWGNVTADRGLDDDLTLVVLDISIPES
ncbi:MAG: SpoIIE family protein phosphatase [bacterium]|nr:SpoIIE family protein phosphatase [bacterium]